MIRACAYSTFFFNHSLAFRVACRMLVQILCAHECLTLFIPACLVVDDVCVARLAKFIVILNLLRSARFALPLVIYCYVCPCPFRLISGGSLHSTVLFRYSMSTVLVQCTYSSCWLRPIRNVYYRPDFVCNLRDILFLVCGSFIRPYCNAQQSKYIRILLYIFTYMYYFMTDVLTSPTSILNFAFFSATLLRGAHLILHPTMTVKAFVSYNALDIRLNSKSG